ncbi:hypothetical protein AHAS_Ahas09G0015500 [Arachis hypogaea]
MPLSTTTNGVCSIAAPGPTSLARGVRPDKKRETAVVENDFDICFRRWRETSLAQRIHNGEVELAVRDDGYQESSAKTVVEGEMRRTDRQRRKQCLWEAAVALVWPVESAA